MPIDRLSRAMPPNLALSEQERAAVLEIAYLAIASDEEISEVEISALRTIAASLGASRADVDRLLATFEGRADREAADARLRTVAAELRTDAARETAYRAAYAVAISDLATSDQEFEFDLQLIDALGLTQADADRISGEVVMSLQPE
jgi:tellurite resistance protein